MKKLLVISFICAAFAVQAQKPSELLRQTSVAYATATYLSVDVLVHSFVSKTDTKGELLGKGLIRKSKNNYYTRFREDEMVVNENCTVIIDHSDHTISYFNDAKSKKKNKKAGMQVPDIDSLLASGDSLVYHGTVKGIRHFTFFSKRGYIRQTEMYVNEQTKFITKIVYFYASNTADEAYDVYKIELDYTACSTQQPAASFFDEKKFITFQKGKPQPNAAFKTYQISYEKD